MNSDLVTVVIPTYNRAFLLGETIRSVLGQSYDNFELLILDDCSTDDTGEIVNTFKDRRIRYVRHEHNLGLVTNWTYGVKMASGRYLSVLGDDDKYELDFLKRRLEAFKTTENIVAATGAFNCCDSEGRFIRSSKSPDEKTKLFQGKELLKFTLGFTGEWFNGATLFRTQLVQSLWDKVMMAGTALDFSLHIRLALLPDARVMFHPDRDMFLRVHPDQESRRNNIHLAGCAAKLAIEMWNYEVKGMSMEIVGLFRQRFADDINHYGRVLWDRGRVIESRNAFKVELSIHPFRATTWLRLLRTYVSRPPDSIEGKT